MGLTYKENCPDIRNSGIKNVINELQKFGCNLDLQDPWADKEEIKKIYSIYPISNLDLTTYDSILIAVAHEEYKKMGIKFISNLCKKNHVIYDLKYLFAKNEVDLRL